MSGESALKIARLTLASDDAIVVLEVRTEMVWRRQRGGFLF